MADSRLVMVEGADDLHVLTNLCMRHGVPKSFKIESNEGKPTVLDVFSTRLLLSKPDDIVGLVMDANGSLERSWQSVRDRLADRGYDSVPSAPDAAGIIIDPPPNTILARVGVWLMPNNRDGGALEDFLLALMPNESALRDHARESIDRIPPELRLFTEPKHSKALMHTYLAWQENPGRPYGTAIKAGYLDANAPPALALVDWIKRLFGS